MIDYGREELTRRRLDPLYRDLERTSATTWDYPEEHYLVVRLDGVKASGALLKDAPRNLDYESALERAVNAAYYMLREWTAPENGNFYLGALAISDEVSFVLNNGLNWYGNRLLKISTVLAGLLSAAMTKSLEIYQPKRGVFKRSGRPEERVLLNFDARPLIFESIDEAVEHLRFRWILGCRNAMGKVLRLKGKITAKDIEDRERWRNLEWMAEKIAVHGLFDGYRDVTRGFRLHVPDQQRKLHARSVPDEANTPASEVFAAIAAYKRTLDAQPREP